MTARRPRLRAEARLSALPAGSQSRAPATASATQIGTPREVAEWAAAATCPSIDGHVHFPDVRIEYERPDGERKVEDVEVVTPHYRGAYAAAKGRTGFTLLSHRHRASEDAAAAPAAVRIPASPRNSWMTHAERVSAVAGFGFTERQAAFLVHVMLHSGCLPGPPVLHVCAASFAARRWPTSSRNLRAAALRDALSVRAQQGPRLPRPHTPSCTTPSASAMSGSASAIALAPALERLMMLDHVIAHRDFTWLGAEQDKVAHFLTTTSLRREELPRLTFGAAPTSPSGTSPTNCRSACRRTGARTSSSTCCQSQIPDDFRIFLRRHAELLRALPAWSIRLLVPVTRPTWKASAGLADVYEAAFREELATPLHPTRRTSSVGSVRAPTVASGPLDERRLRRARRAFGAPRFRAMRRPGCRTATASSMSRCSRRVCRRDRPRERPVGTP